MRLPSYTAELSLRLSSDKYAGISKPTRRTANQGVEPQLCSCYDSGYCHCINCSDGICWTHDFHLPAILSIPTTTHNGVSLRF
jgi:hypothetical protein